ncbi:MAG: YdgA family protein [Chromatiales bacterium]|nr:YdgA family protein [Chromatiales bacterium]
MKKILLGALVLVAAILVGLPGYLGSQVEQRYQAQVDQIKRAGFKVLDQRYERGWFDAVAETRLGLLLPTELEAEMDEEVTFTIQSDIAHGPWLSAPFSGLAEINTRILVDDKSIFPEDYPAKINTLVAMDGSGETLIDFPKHMMEKEESKIDFGGLQGTVQFDSTFKEVDMQLTMPSVLISEDNAQGFAIQGVRIDTRSRPGSSGLALGGGAVVVDSMTVEVPEGGKFELAKLEIEAASSEQGEDKVSAGATYRFQLLDLEGQQYGPAEMQITVDNLPTSVLLEIQKGMEEIQANQSSIEQQQMAMMTMLFSSGPEFIASDPKLSINKLYLKTPEGEVKGDFSLQSVGLEWKDISNPAVIMERLQGAAQLTVPRAYLDKILLERMTNELRTQELLALEQGAEPQDQASIEEQAKMLANMQIDMMLGQGFLQQQDGMISASAKLDGGQLTVNGKAIPLPVPGAQ